jgi:hypothetical protein
MRREQFKGLAMNASRIKDHKVKGGKVISPWNYKMGETLKFSSWALNRLPEYIWLALILEAYGRDKGLRCAATILQEIASYEKELDTPRLSKILSLPTPRQEAIYQTIKRNTRKNIFSPLTTFIDSNANELFWDYFYEPKDSMEVRLALIQSVIKKNYFHQSHEATDIRYLVMLNMIYHEKIKFSRDCTETIEALQKYPITSHDDEKMRSYRPMVRAGEMHMGEVNSTYVKMFWNSIGMKTECQLFIIGHKEFEMDHKTFTKDFADVLEYIWFKNKEEAQGNDRLTVILSMVTYLYKIMRETIDSKIGNTISARFSVRTVAEVYVMLKYLIKLSVDKPTVWKDFKQYGIGKYKLVLLKSREVDVAADSHIIPPIIEVLVNEEIWEEFVDSDLRYFDQMGIREKCIFVDEKELYDLLYDYDTNYVHGFWAAIREAAMVKCDNPAHNFHAVPDFFMKQQCSDVIPDMIKLLKKAMALVTEHYELPSWYLEKYPS